MSLKVGVIGAGRWGQNHVRIYSELGCDLAGIADVNQDVRSVAKRFKTAYFSDYRKMLDKVDAVSVVVPTDLHYKVVMDCLDAGKHVLVEKPITLKSSETRELIRTAKKKGLILMVGYLFRFNAAAIETKNILREIGKVHYVTARYIHSNKPPRKDCGVIFNFTSHLMDILNFLFEKNPRSVFCKKVNHLSRKREDCALITLDYGDFISNLEVTWFHPQKKRDMWIIASEEKVYVDFLEQMIVRYPIKVSDGKVLSQKEINVEIRKNEPLKDEIRMFCSSIEEGMLGNGESEEVITELCEKCIESAETGKEVKV